MTFRRELVLTSARLNKKQSRTVKSSTLLLVGDPIGTSTEQHREFIGVYWQIVFILNRILKIWSYSKRDVSVDINIDMSSSLNMSSQRY